MEFLLDSASAVDMNSFQRVTMLDVLSSPEGFDLFLLHILKEFSTENMLAVIEFTQFQQYFNDESVWDRMDNEELSLQISMSVYESSAIPTMAPLSSGSASTKERGMKSERAKVRLPQHVPSSLVVHSDESIIDKVKALVEKYIVVGSKFELNLSGHLRAVTIKKYQQMILGELEEEEGRFIFDDAKNEIMRLMDDSFRRFKTTQEFEKFLHRKQKARAFHD